MKTIAKATSWALALACSRWAAATPWFTQDPRTLPEGKWRVEEHVLYSEVNEALFDGRTTPLPNGVTEASMLIFHTRIRYGLRSDLTVFIDLPLVEKRVHGAAGVLTNRGLGDISLLAKYKYREDNEGGKRRAVAGFVKFHNGEYKGVPNLLATGSGHDDYGLVHLWEWRRGRSIWYGNVGYVHRGTRSDVNINLGDSFIFNLAAEHRLGNSSANLVWEINGRHEAPNEQARRALPNTGATIISLSPAMQYVDQKSDGRSITFEAGVQIPVLKDGNLPALPDYTVYAGGYAVF